MKKSVSVPENKKPQEQQTAVKKPRRSRCRHVFKLLSLSLCALALLLVGALSFILFTTSGARMALSTAQRFTAGMVWIQAEIKDGSIYSGLDLSNVEVTIPQVIQIRADALALSYDLIPVLTRGRFRADEIAADNLAVELLDYPELNPDEAVYDPADAAQKEAEEAAAAANAEPFRLVFPLDLEIGRLKVNNFAFLSSAVDVHLKSFEALLQAGGDSALMQDAAGSDLVVQVKNAQHPVTAAESLADRLGVIAAGRTAAPFVSARERWAQEHPEPPADVPDFSDGSGVIAMLPTVALPLDVTVLNLQVDKARYFMEGFDTGLTENLNLTATWQGTKLSVLRLDARHPAGEILISGLMDFREHYYLDFNVSGAGSLSEYNQTFLGGALYGLQGRGKVKGSLVDLNADVQLLNPADTELKVRFNCLSALLPLDAELTSPHLEYPLFHAGKPLAVGENIHLKTAGTLMQGMETALHAVLTGYGFEHYAVEFTGGVALDRMRIDRLNLSGVYQEAMVTAQAAGDFSWAGALTWDGAVEVSSSDGGIFSPMLRGPLSAEAESQSTVILPAVESAELNVTAQVPTLRASLVLNGVPADLNVAQLSGSLLEGFTVKELNFIQGENQLQAAGRLNSDDRITFNAQARLPQLELLAPGVTGDFTGSVTAQGTPEDFSVRLSGSSQRVAAGGARVRRLALDAGFNRSDSSFNVTAVADTMRLAQGLKPARQCVLDLSGSLPDHSLSFVCGGENRVFLSAHGDYDKEALTWSGALEELYFSSKLSGSVSLADKVQAVLNFADASGEISPIELRTDAGSMQISRTVYTADSLHTAVKLNQVDLKSLNDLLPEGVHMSGPVQLDSSIVIEQGLPHIDAKLSSNEARIMAKGVPLLFDKLHFNAAIEPQLAEVEAQISLRHGRGSADIDLAVHDPLGAQRLGGSAVLKDLDLGLFMGVGTVFNDLQGRVNLDSTLAGSVSKPLLLGQMHAQGSAEPRYDVGQIDSFDVTLNSQGQSGALSGYIGLNQGRLYLNGELDWSEGAYGFLNVTAKRLPAFLMGFGQAYADIDARAEFKDYFKATGSITIPQAQITVGSLGISGQTPSGDEIIVPEGGTSVLMQQVSAPVPSMVDLDIQMGDDVRVDAMGLTAKVIGALHLNKAPADPDIAGTGSIELTEGKAALYGHHFMVNRARASFNGPLANPTLDVEIAADPEEMEDNVEAGVRVTGDVNQPQVRLFSDPAMSQNEILSYLLYGHGLDKNSNLNEGSNASMLVGLGVSSAGSLVNSVIGAFGVQNVQVNAAGSGDDTQVQVQGYITRNIRVGYGYGVFNAIGEFKLRYEFMRRLYAEFVSSVDQAVDLIYSFEF